MAEIEIQRKKRPVWPWIVGLLAVLAIAWLAIEAMDGDRADTAAMDPVTPSAGEQAPVVTDPFGEGGGEADEVARFESQCVDPAAGQQMARSHEHTATCITTLAASLESAAERGNLETEALQPAFEDLRSAADRIRQDATSAQHAGSVREAFVTTAALVERMASARGGERLQQPASELREAAEEIDADAPLLEQNQRIDAFFRHAASVLRNLNESPATAI